MNVQGDQAVDMNTFRRWLMRFSNGDSSSNNERQAMPNSVLNPRISPSS